MISVDWVKNDIFSLGLTFLEALTLKSAENLNCLSSANILDDILYYLALEN